MPNFNFTNFCLTDKLLLNEFIFGGEPLSKEKEILQLIKRNPFLSQQDIAEQVGLSRPAVANYISKLIEEKEIIGRAYVLNEKNTIVCIGGANIDRKAMAKGPVLFESSNPVVTEETLGGVARNVAHNLNLLNQKIKLFTFVGADREGESMIEQSEQLGMDMSLTVTIPNMRTGTYTAFINTDGELIISLADMDIYDHVTVQMIESKWHYLADAKAIFIDTNISNPALQYVIKKCAEAKSLLFVDPVSAVKAKKLPHDLSGIHTIFPNKEEAEAMSGINIEKESDCKKAALMIQNRGVKNVIITLGEQGIFYQTEEDSGTFSPFETEIKDVTGAGDAFTSCFIYGIVTEQPFKNACQYGLAGAALTLKSPKSVATELRHEKLIQLMRDSI